MREISLAMLREQLEKEEHALKLKQSLHQKFQQFSNRKKSIMSLGNPLVQKIGEGVVKNFRQAIIKATTHRVVLEPHEAAEQRLVKELSISKGKKFALYFIKMVLKEDLYQRAIARFKALVKNKAQKE
jgi:hypothetical protein